MTADLIINCVGLGGASLAPVSAPARMRRVAAPHKAVEHAR